MVSLTGCTTPFGRAFDPRLNVFFDSRLDMALKKSELCSLLWSSCELGGGMDASQYKDYVLVLKENNP